MHVAKSILLLLAGAIAGIAFVISCGDNLHLSADAASDAPKVIDAPKATDAAPACDCPATEPPLAGRFVVASGFLPIPGNGSGAKGIACPTGATLISGSCTTDVLAPIRNVTLEQSGFFQNPPEGWYCFFRNNEPTPVTIKVSITCLKPAP